MPPSGRGAQRRRGIRGTRWAVRPESVYRSCRDHRHSVRLQVIARLRRIKGLAGCGDGPGQPAAPRKRAMADSDETPLGKRSMSRNAMLTGWRVSPVWRVTELADAADGKTYARLINEGDSSVQKT